MHSWSVIVPWKWGIFRREMDVQLILWFASAVPLIGVHFQRMGATSTRGADRPARPHFLRGKIMLIKKTFVRSGPERNIIG